MVRRPFASAMYYHTACAYTYVGDLGGPLGRGTHRARGALAPADSLWSCRKPPIVLRRQEPSKPLGANFIPRHGLARGSSAPSTLCFGQFVSSLLYHLHLTSLHFHLFTLGQRLTIRTAVLCPSSVVSPTLPQPWGATHVRSQPSNQSHQNPSSHPRRPWSLLAAQCCSFSDLFNMAPA